MYSFSHLTFQEYFTAKYIIANAAKGTLTNLIKAHCADARWREVFLLVTSMLPDASQFTMAFRQHGDGLLEDNENLKALLSWVDNRTASLKGPSWSARLRYLFVELTYLTHSPFLELALESAVDRDTDLGRALKKYVNSAWKMSSDLEVDIVLSINLQLIYLICHFDGTPNFPQDIKRNFARISSRDIPIDLKAFSLPSDEAADSAWQRSFDRLRRLTIKHRDIGHDWKFSEMEELRLADYVNATNLLNDCLEFAFMPPDEKKAMLNSLFLPPAAAGGVQKHRH